MIKKTAFLLVVSILAIGVLSAQSSVKGASVNGLTGLMTTPTARIGWEKSDIGLDLGYSYLGNGGDTTHIPRMTLSLFTKAEVAAAVALGDNDDMELMLAGKFQFYRSGGSSMAGGVDFSSYDYNTQVENTNTTLLRPYIVATYGGDFFDAPAVTSMAFGWDLDRGNGFEFENFNYSMGFEMSLFPKTFKNFIFLMSDFSNYGFSGGMGRITTLSTGRGVFNTGLRIDPVKDSQYKFVIDLVGTDLLDANRGFMIDATFGLAL
jgi:hypothetical protein